MYDCVESPRGIFVPLFCIFRPTGLRIGNIGRLVHHFGPASNPGLIAMKSGTAICGAQRMWSVSKDSMKFTKHSYVPLKMTCNHIGDTLTLHLVPSAGQHFKLSSSCGYV